MSTRSQSKSTVSQEYDYRSPIIYQFSVDTKKRTHRGLFFKIDIVHYIVLISSYPAQLTDEGENESKKDFYPKRRPRERNLDHQVS
jgi:hypothetical protein